MISGSLGAGFGPVVSEAARIPIADDHSNDGPVASVFARVGAAPGDEPVRWWCRGRVDMIDTEYYCATCNAWRAGDELDVIENGCPADAMSVCCRVCGTEIGRMMGDDDASE